jgi:hypothetical protein
MLTVFAMLLVLASALVLRIVFSRVEVPMDRWSVAMDSWWRRRRWWRPMLRRLAALRRANRRTSLFRRTGH